MKSIRASNYFVFFCGAQNPVSGYQHANSFRGRGSFPFGNIKGKEISVPIGALEVALSCPFSKL